MFVSRSYNYRCCIILNGKINVTTHSLYAGHHCSHSAIVYEQDLIPIDNKKNIHEHFSIMCI